MTDMPVNENEEALEGGERRSRLSALLGDLVKRKGRMEAAKLLGVNYKTVVRAEETGRITDHVGQALDKLLGDDEGAEVPGNGTLEDRIERLEGGGGGAKGAEGVCRGPAKGRRRDGCRQPARRKGVGVQDEEGRVGTHSETITPVPGMRQLKPSSERRVDPEIVTEEPAGDDPEVYGPAWPPVEEWRRLRANHPHRGKSMSWLLTEERLLVLELDMLEEHGLTLPPETQPLRGSGAGARPRGATRPSTTPGGRCENGRCSVGSAGPSPSDSGGDREPGGGVMLAYG